VAIAIQDDEGPDAAVDPRFRRAVRFVIAAADGSAVQVVDNPGATAGHGAGIGAAALLVRRGVGASRP
jgi:predicted Fe-Mo cluster-binding NifX family protein